MGLGNNRDYKTTARKAKTNLQKHSLRMEELVKEGMNREDASSQAYNELFKKLPVANNTNNNNK